MGVGHADIWILTEAAATIPPIRKTLNINLSATLVHEVDVSVAAIEIDRLSFLAFRDTKGEAPDCNL